MFDHCSIEVSDFDLIIGRHSKAFSMSPEQRAEADEAQRILDAVGMYQSGVMTASTGHRVIDYELLLREGVEGVLARVKAARAALDPHAPEFHETDITYQSMEISLSALIRFGARAKAVLSDLAAKTEDDERRAQLETMTAIFDQVPAKPARTFYEAIQSMWFVQFALCLIDDISLTGHPDRYLYPYYKADLEAGRITKEFAMQLIEQLYYKHNELYGSWPASLMVGGVDREGKPVWNELTYMCIEAIRTTGLINPSVSVCYTEDMPD
ncbi:MAG: pyruvate formate lyase family protein, partial [Clostridia bacterium]|nr:pyruvate formate lyase family protein [Clostridia bacterium]